MEAVYGVLAVATVLVAYLIGFIRGSIVSHRLWQAWLAERTAVVKRTEVSDLYPQSN